MEKFELLAFMDGLSGAKRINLFVKVKGNDVLCDIIRLYHIGCVGESIA